MDYRKKVWYVIKDANRMPLGDHEIYHKNEIGMFDEDIARLFKRGERTRIKTAWL